MNGARAETRWTPDAWLIALLCLAITLLLYTPSLHFYFVGDDIAFLRPNPHWLREALIPGGPWHYYPINQILLYALPALTDRRPEAMHLLNLLVHAGMGAGLYAWLHRLGADRRAGFIASLFFVSRGVSYEVVAWITELSYLSIVGYTLLTLFWWDRYLRGRGTKYLGWTVGGFTAALLTIEHALLLLPLYVLFDLIMGREKSLFLPSSVPGERIHGWRQQGPRVVKGSLRYLPFVLIVLVFLGVKAAHHGGLFWSSAGGDTVAHAPPLPSGETLTTQPPPDRSWLGMLNTPRRAYLDLLLGASYVFLPVSGCYAAQESWLTRHPWLCLVPWLALHVWVWLKGRPLTRFLLAWVYVYLLPLALAAVPQARYYYMATVPAAGLVGLGLAAAWNRARGRVPARPLGGLIAALLALLVFGEGVFIRARLEEWRLASDLVRRTLTLLEHDARSQVRDVYLVNFPRAVPGPFWPAYAFGNAAAYLNLMLRPPMKDLRIHPVYDRSFVGARWPTTGAYASMEEVRDRLREPEVRAYQFVDRPPWITRMR